MRNSNNPGGQPCPRIFSGNPYAWEDHCNRESFM